jgi:hypothetical protein
MMRPFSRSACRRSPATPAVGKRIRSEPSALNQLNNEHNDSNHEQEMDQAASNVTDKAKKPEHH